MLPRASEAGDGDANPDDSCANADSRPHTPLQRVRLHGPASGIRVTVIDDRLPVPTVWKAAAGSLMDGGAGAECALAAGLTPRVSRMGSKKASASRAKSAVLPPQAASGGQKVERAGDLLSDAQRKSLRTELSQLARIRREAEASSATLRLS